MASTEKLEIRAIRGDTPTKIFEKIAATHGKHAVSRTVDFDWHKYFREGNTSITDKEGRGRKKKVTTTLVTLVANALENDRRLTVRALMAKFDVSYGAMQTRAILTNDLKMRKVHARWVLRLLKDTEMVRRVQDSRAFLRRVKREGDDFLSRIITTDETWLWFYDPETRSQTAVWKRSSSPPPKKARVPKCGGKYMFIMFADMHGMILQHAVPKNTTVNSDYYCKVLLRDLTNALRKKRPGVPLEHFILHMANASAHTSAKTELEVAVIGFGRVAHPPYSRLLTLPFFLPSSLS